MADPALPSRFSHLQFLADEWSLPSERDRQLRRAASTIEELDTVFATLSGEIVAMLDYLNARDFDALTAEETNLLNLALSLAEIAPAVQIFRTPGNPDGFDFTRVVPGQ